MDPDHHRSIVEHAPTMIWSGGPEASCDYVNAAWLTYTGQTLEDTLGDGWHECFHPDDRLAYLALYAERVARREPFEWECRLRRHDGVYRVVRLLGAPRVAPEGALTGIVVSGSAIHGDLGPDDLDQEASAEGEFFERLLDHLCVAGFDGYWKRLNPSWSRTLGWTTRELMSRPLIEFVHPDDREATISARGRLKLGTPLRSLTNRYRHKDGSYRWFEWRSIADADRELVFAVARDITAEHDNRLAMAELTESLAATLRSLADGLIGTDAEAAITRMNPVAEALTGWSAADALGRPLGEVFSIVHADTRAPTPFPIARTLQEGMASERLEHTLLVSRDGREVPIAFSRAPLRGPEGEVRGAVIVFRDMTAEKEARQEQERLHRQLMLADRMASVGTLAAGVAHEINNPLAYVMANLDLILDELRKGDIGPSQVAEWLEMAREARQGTEKISKIVRGLKTFSRTEEQRHETLDLRPVLEQAIEMAFNEIRHRARLVTDFGVTPLVVGDETRLVQVFVNLLVNAAQALPEGHGDAHEIRISTSTDDAGQAVVEVQDTGPGIPPELLDRVFDPFFTTKEIGVGTGLGLSTCHNIVSNMGGRIAASNRDGGGAVLQITLPAAAPDEVSPATEASDPQPAPQVRPAIVLVVDDERAIGASLVRVLRGHDVTAVTSAKEALEIVEARPSFDVILSDVMMPEMSGIEFYEELHRRRPALAERVIFITGGAFTDTARDFLERVPNERLDKPFNTTALRAMVDRSVR